MYTNFLRQDPQTHPVSSVACESIALPPSKEPLKCIIVGSRQGVTSTIQRLHQLGFAEIGNWSPLQPTQNPAEFMSVLIRYIPRS